MCTSAVFDRYYHTSNPLCKRLYYQELISVCHGVIMCRHLIFCICDLLLEFLIPESCDEAFQSSLLQSLAKDAEREPSHI